MNNEITVKLKCNIEEICKILENKEFQFVEKYLLDDSYYIPSTINIKRAILSSGDLFCFRFFLLDIFMINILYAGLGADAQSL